MNIVAAQIVLKIMFWVGIFGVAVKSLGLCVFTYPRMTTTAIGWDVMSVVIGLIACMAYAWILGWLA